MHPNHKLPDLPYGYDALEVRSGWSPLLLAAGRPPAAAASRWLSGPASLNKPSCPSSSACLVRFPSLQPYVDTQTMTLHHTKHHQASLQGGLRFQHTTPCLFISRAPARLGLFMLACPLFSPALTLAAALALSLADRHM